MRAHSAKFISLLITSLTMTLAAPQAHATTVDIPVDAGQSDPDVILGTVNFVVIQPVYIRMDQLSYRVSSWGSGSPTNVGTTTRIRCYDVLGAPTRHPQYGLITPHFGQNIVRSETIYPQVHTMITSPGAYTCKVAAQAYSTASAPGMTVRADITAMRFTATAQNIGSDTWADTGGDVGIAPGQGMLRFMRDFPIVPDGDVVFVVDQQLTNCTNADEIDRPGICGGAGPYGTPGNRFRLYTSIRPLGSDGMPCGEPLLSINDEDISDATHHRTLISAIHYTLPAGCLGVRAHAGIRMFNGDKGWVHGPYNYARATMIL